MMTLYRVVILWFSLKGGIHVDPLCCGVFFGATVIIIRLRIDRNCYKHRDKESRLVWPRHYFLNVWLQSLRICTLWNGAKPRPSLWWVGTSQEPQWGPLGSKVHGSIYQLGQGVETERGVEGEAPEHCKRMPRNVTWTMMSVLVEYHATIKMTLIETTIKANIYCIPTKLCVLFPFFHLGVTIIFFFFHTSLLEYYCFTVLC